MALWPHLHQVHLGSGAAAPGKLPGKLTHTPSKTPVNQPLQWSRPFQSLRPDVQVSPWDGSGLLVYYVPPCIQTPRTPESSLCELRTASSTFHALHCRRAVVHLCGTLCPFISRTAIWLLQLSCAILSLISSLSTDFVLSAFGVWSHKRAI